MLRLKRPSTPPAHDRAPPVSRIPSPPIPPKPVSKEVYVLTRKTLQVHSGDGKDAESNSQKLTYCDYLYDELPVYGPANARIAALSKPHPWFSAMLARPLQPLPASDTKPTETPEKRRVVFHLVNCAEHVKDGIADPGLSVNGKYQCRNLRSGWLSQRRIQYVFCSPSMRAIQTAYFAFGDHVRMAGGIPDKRGAIMPWSALRSCPDSDIQPAELGLTEQGKPLTELQDSVKDKDLILFGRQLVKEGWENDHNEACSRESRADEVRKSLYELQHVIIKGGVWRNLEFQPLTLWNPSQDVGIAIVSHTDFLSLLSRDKTNVGQNFETAQARSYLFDVEGDIRSGKLKDTWTETKDSSEREFLKDAARRLPQAGWGDA